MFDLHSHSYYSDGSDSPSFIVESAAEAGLSLFALTDHDTADGVFEAERRAAELKLPLLTGAEIEAEYSDTLHILALGFDMKNADITALFEEREHSRLERNARLSRRLAELGMDVSAALVESEGATTRANYAAALVELGHAESMRDAFSRILGRDCPAHVAQKHPAPEEVVGVIKRAGGVAVIAHPMKMKLDPAALIADMKRLGVWGVEAYYGAATQGETQLFASLARQNGLLVTAGSDYHGKRRPEAFIGKGWRPEAALSRTEAELMQLVKKRPAE